VGLNNYRNRHGDGGAAKLLFIIIIVLVALPVAWTFLSLHWAYADGERAGVLQKFARKGWICKTYEGELAQYIVAGVSPQIWYFTVHDEKVLAQMKSLVGQKVQLHYTEHKGLPGTCFGDTSFFVEGVTKLDDKAMSGAMPY
jgi:hypothetical protein